MKSVNTIDEFLRFYNVQNYDSSIIEDGKIYLYGKLIALYDWLDDNTPHFFFVDPQKNYKQKLCLPFLHMLGLRDNIIWLIQEIKSQLTLEEALQIRFKRDKYSDYLLYEKITNKISKILLGRPYWVDNVRYSVDQEFCDEYMKHFAFCAIEEI